MTSLTRWNDWKIAQASDSYNRIRERRLAEHGGHSKTTMALYDENLCREMAHDLCREAIALVALREAELEVVNDRCRQLAKHLEALHAT